MLKQENNTVQAMWIGMGSFSSFALSLVSAAILSRYFDKTEYGTYRQILFRLWHFNCNFFSRFT